MPNCVDICLEVHGSLYAVCEEEAQARLVAWVREKLCGESGAYHLDGSDEITVQQVAAVAARPGCGYLFPIPVRVTVTPGKTGWPFALLTALHPPAALLEKQKKKARTWAESVLKTGATEAGIVSVSVLTA